MNFGCRGQALASAAKRSSCGAVCLEHNLLLERTPRWFKSKWVSGDHILSFPGVLFVFLSSSLDDAVPSCPGLQMGCATPLKSADLWEMNLPAPAAEILIPFFLQSGKEIPGFSWCRVEEGEGCRIKSMIKHPQCWNLHCSCCLFFQIKTLFWGSKWKWNWNWTLNLIFR